MKETSPEDEDEAHQSDGEGDSAEEEEVYEIEQVLGAQKGKFGPVSAVNELRVHSLRSAGFLTSCHSRRVASVTS